MESFQERVVIEKNELDSRLEKLIKFIGSDKFDGVPGLEQNRLRRQQLIMELYSEVLVERINNFT